MSKSSLIYFLRKANGLVKIGLTRDLTQRISGLSRGHGPLEVLRVLNGDRAREKAIHHQFRKYWEYGEWFRLEDGFTKLMNSLPDGEKRDVMKSEVERAWSDGELAMAKESTRVCDRLVMLRMQRTGLRSEAARLAVAEDYGFKPWVLSHTHKGRPRTVSAYLLKRLRECLIAEMKTAEAELISEIETAKADHTYLSVVRS